MLRSFLSDVRGGIAVIFALTVIPLLGVVGAAVDHARLVSAREAAQVVVDSAALVGVTGASSFERERLAENHARDRLGGLPNGAQAVSVTAREAVDPQTGARRMTVRVSGRVQPAIVQVVGVGPMTFTVEAEAETSKRIFEIALVVDVTGSMRGARINALRRSAEAFVKAFLDGGGDTDNLRLALVPYTAAVNIDRARSARLAPAPGGLVAIAQNRYVFEGHEVSQAWCRGDGVSWNDTLELCHIGPLQRLYGPGPCPGVMRDDVCWVADAWAGCVMERVGTPYELDDTPPTTAPFRPYYWNSWGNVGNPNGNGGFNSYLPGPIDASRHTNANSNNGRGPNLGCPQSPIVSWTRDQRLLLDEIRRFEAWHRGGTMGHVGLLWGWRMLSPAWRGLWDDPDWPHDYDPGRVEKIVVFMTDGDNLFFAGMAPSSDSDYTAYGRLSDNPGFTRANNTRLLDERMLRVCATMRGLGIELFTVGFHISANARDLLRRCATSPRHFFDSDTSTLEQHFSKIASEIRERRVVISR